MEGLPIWVIYERPSDYPNSYLARLWIGEEPTGQIILSHELDFLRRLLIAKGLTKLDRMDGDDPVILETWL